MLEAVADKVVHVHAKDISSRQASAERGKVTGTAVGCACGDGEIDWRRIVRRLSRNCVKQSTRRTLSLFKPTSASKLRYLQMLNFQQAPLTLGFCLGSLIVVYLLLRRT